MLRDALGYVKDGQLEPALTALLDAWREQSDPRLADVIDRVSAILTETEKPVVAVGSKSAKTAWYEAADAKRPAILGRLIEAAPDALDRVKRLDALLKWPRDPRIGSAARAWIEAPPVKGKNRPGFFNKVWELVEHTRDSRVAPLIAEISATRASAINRYGLRSWVPLTELGAKVAKQKPAKPLAKEDVAVLEAIEASLATPAKKAAGGTSADEAELWDRIYADLGDDEARVVLADLLQQRGDPRGEFIAMQMARFGTDKPRSSAEKKLEQQWGRKWLGVLDEVLLKEGIEFERGFVAKCRYEGDGLKKTSYGAREWSTVTHIDCTRASRYVSGSGELLVRPELRNVRHVTGLSADDHPKLAGHDLPWETVGWRTWSIERGTPIPDGKQFPAAKTLIIEQAEGRELAVTADWIGKLLAAWPTVTELEVDGYPQLVADILAKTKLTRLVMGGRPLVVTAAGDTLTASLRHLNDETVAAVAHLMRQVMPKNMVLRAGNKGASDGQELVAGDSRISVKPIIDAARELGIPLHVHGTKFD